MIIFTMNIERDWEIPDAHRIEILAHFDAAMPEYENEAFNTLLEDQAGHLPEKPFLIAKIYGTLFPVRPAATPAELCLELTKAGRPGQGLNENAEYFVNIRDAAAFMRDNLSVATLFSGIDKVARGFSIQHAFVNKGVSEAGILPHMLAELDLLAGPSNGLFFVTPVQRVDIGQSRLLDTQAQVLSFSNIFYAKHRRELTPP